MVLQGRNSILALSFGTVLWIVIYFIISCSALPKPQSSIKDNSANFSLTNDAPIITPVLTHITLEVGSSYALCCEFSEPITWRANTPITLELNQSLNHDAALNKDSQYRNFLYLNDVTVEYVGYFYCIKEREFIKDIDYDMLVKDYKAAKIYVFVNDSEVLLVPFQYPVITASQDEDILIPCKPTMPETVVELITNDQQVHSSEATSRYDPKCGFIVQIQGFANVGEYSCKPQQPSPFNEGEEVNFWILYSGTKSNNPKDKMTHVAIPEIYSNNDRCAFEGETFNLTCSVEVTNTGPLKMVWETPLDNNTEHRLIYTNVTNDINEKTIRIAKNSLIVTNAQKSDGGNYKCIVKDDLGNSANNTYLMTILKNNESYINISEPNNYYTITTKASKNIMMNVNYKGFPTPTFSWYAPGLKLIEPNKKYQVNRTKSSISLQINHVELFDTGVYVLKANNSIDEKQLEFNLYVKAKPQVSIENIYIQAGEQARIFCKAYSYPTAKIIWTYNSCNISPKWPSCKDDVVTFNSTQNSTDISKIERVHELIFKPDRPGRMKCTAVNSIGNSSSEGYVLIGDLTSNMTAYGVDENLKIARGDEVIVTCAALAYFYSADLDWFKDGQMITNDSDIEIKMSFSDYSYKKIIKFKSIEDKHAGSYECRARVVDNEVDYDSKFLTLIVYEPAIPVLVQSNLGEQYKRALGESLELICQSQGIPKPNITWYKDDKKLNANRNIFILEDNSVLKIPVINPADEGLYKCVSSNRLGNITASSQVKIKDMPGLKLSSIIGIGFFITLLIISIIFLGIRILKERKINRLMKLAGLANFEEGALEEINPDIALDEQAELLPYDRRFEFPRHKLKLGKKLGSGAFGVVLIAHAEGIIPEEKETVVAVKMVKRTADNEVLKALVSELKIMVHLGQHLNVVNLLGAVTKNIAQREIMVIVEYCCYGNVQSFLLRNRKRFINQIDPITDKIDPTIIEQTFSGGELEINRNSVSYSRSGSHADSRNSNYYWRKSDLYEGYADDCPPDKTVLTTISEGEDQILSTDSVQPKSRTNYYKDDLTHTMTINTSDLVSWAFQVTRGMDYLSSRKVLHGDLAARNILLCEDNVVKICDFGLARSMYKNDNYKKQHKALLPIKWLALESISDQIFSTYTDVWSFGIMLWEFFSLARVPYPGIDANQTLYMKLQDGYRMEKPPYANKELYEIMLECWSFNPERRPHFRELEKKFARLLGEEVTSHYMDLNEPYLKINNEHMQQSERDYLALMGSPDEMAPLPPRYVNEMILPETRIYPSDDNLQISSKTDKYSPEEIPMLQNSFNGVYRGESQYDSKTEKSSAESTLTDSTEVNLSKKFMNRSNGTKAAFCNPSYLILKKAVS